MYDPPPTRELPVAPCRWCTGCWHENPRGARRCHRCGESLQPAPVETVPGRRSRVDRVSLCLVVLMLVLYAAWAVAVICGV